jgi:hypothetical protein
MTASSCGYQVQPPQLLRMTTSLGDMNRLNQDLQADVDKALAMVEGEFSKRGVMMLATVELLLDLLFKARFAMNALEKKMRPLRFMNARWHQQKEALHQHETRLMRILLSVSIPIDDHECAPKGTP